VASIDKGATRPSALDLRAAAADTLTAENFAVMDLDMAIGEDLPLCATLDELRERIVLGNTWGCEALLHALAQVLTTRCDEPVGIVVAYRSDRLPHLFGDIKQASGASQNAALATCRRISMVVYHDESTLHYQLLGDTQRRVAYNVSTQLFMEGR
jgi:hypothetical protein